MWFQMASTICGEIIIVINERPVMINCIYHPVYPMRVVNDEEYGALLATGQWFKHPKEAEEERLRYERQIRRDHGKRGRPSKAIRQEV